MHFVTIEFDRDQKRWVADLENVDSGYSDFRALFDEAAKNSKLRWEALDFFQKYQFKLLIEEDGPKLRFLGVDARYGEYVPATKDQMVLGAPA